MLYLQRDSKTHKHFLIPFAIEIQTTYLKRPIVLSPKMMAKQLV